MNYNKYQLLSLQTSINKQAFHVVLFINKRSPCRWWGPRRLRPFTRRDRKVGQQDGSADKSTWCLTWQPRTQDGAGHTPEVALWPSRVCGGTHTHSQRHYIILLKMSRRKIFRLLLFHPYSAKGFQYLCVRYLVQMWVHTAIRSTLESVFPVPSFRLRLCGFLESSLFVASIITYRVILLLTTYIFVIFFFFLWDRVSLCNSPDFLGTHSVDQADFKFRNPPASAGIKVMSSQWISLKCIFSKSWNGNAVAFLTPNSCLPTW